MTQAINILQWLVFTCLFIQVAYLLFFSIAGKLARPENIPVAKYQHRIRVFIPGYKEDMVIADTARQAVNQNYPADKFEVIVIADSFSAATMQALNELPVEVLEVKFDKSTKGKALQKAISNTINDPVDVAVVLDADNVMAPGFLHAVNNAYNHGYNVMQGHRTAKNSQTAFALLDACTEEINNHIFRRGHVAVGLPSALIGSGMAFDWYLFTSLLKSIGDTAGEDKEMEFRMMRARESIAFLDGAYVYDEKVSRKEVFSSQRSRWIAMQLEFLYKYFREGWIELFKGNVAFFNKVFQTYLLPRVMLVGFTGLYCVVNFLFFPHWSVAGLSLLVALALSLLMGIPAAWYNKRLLMAFMKIPVALFSFISALLQVRKAKHHFVHTPHGETLHT